MPSKKYVLKLLPDERSALAEVVREPRAPGWKVLRARALLECDQRPGGPAWPDARIAEALECTVNSLENWRKQAVLQGPLSPLEKQPYHRRTPPKLDGEGQARLTALACSPAPRGHARWTLRLLAERLVSLEVVDSISHETVRRALKNELQPWRKQMWCIPPVQDAAFVAHLEQVLEVYKRPYDPRRPVLCMDEQSKQLISDVVRPLAPSPGHPERIDHEYVREGQCTVWMFVEPLAGWRSVRTTDRRTGVDWARQIQRLVNDRRYAQADRLTLVCDNLNTHHLGSLYQAFEPAEALRIAQKIELVYTPKHGSWLNAAEPELSALTRQCLNCRISTRQEVGQLARIWKNCRNRNHVHIDWQFRTDNARIKLRHLYPKMLN